MATGTFTGTVNIAGLNYNVAATRTGSGSLGQDPALAAADAGTLSTRTDNDTGVAAMAEGHGITTGQKVDVYWTGGVRRGMDTTVSSNNITIDGGSGDNLPAQSTAVILCVQTTLDIDFDGDLLAMLVIVSTTRSHVEFFSAADASLLAIELAANEPFIWYSDCGITNPLASADVAYALVSNGDSANAATLRISGIYDSDS